MGKKLSKSSNTNAGAELPFSLEGVRLSWLKTFYETICKPNAELANGTTTVICERYIKPATKKLQCSMCDLLQIQEPNATGRASVFISHAWKYKFSDVVE
eukprot:gene17338-19896_t